MSCYTCDRSGPLRAVRSGQSAIHSAPTTFAAEALVLDFEAPSLESKLTKYVLNLDHESGQHKAVLFRDLLGISASDWRYLRNQLVAGLAKAAVQEVRTAAYDGANLVQYEAMIAVYGLNGKVKPVRTAWKFAEDGLIELVTAYVDDQKIDLSELAPATNPWLLKGTRIVDDDWRQLYQEAHQAAVIAAELWTPTPITINDVVEPEGVVGWASVWFVKAPAGLEMWLLRNRLARRRRSGVELAFVHRTQSLERAESYVKRFAEYIGVHGVPCQLHTYLR
ncbi:MAG: hypothetical protein QOF51_1743 [Chloroflexota bacterium]|jgi:hypothetical protein|nr:hypothetical protein [Chloroflexota bacterium]